jgi:hypothetical protein
VVQGGGESAAPADRGPSTITASPLLPIEETARRASFEHAIYGSNLANSQVAFRVAKAAHTIIGGALDIRRKAASYAPDKFIQGVTPGENTTKAADTVLRTHVSEAMLGKCRQHDLRKAALRACDELTAAHKLATSVGMDSQYAIDNYYRDAQSMLFETFGSNDLNQKLLMGAALVGSGIAIGLLVHWAISSRSKPSPSTRPRR